MLMGSATRPIVGVVRSLRGLECVSVPRPLRQVSIQGSFRTKGICGWAATARSNSKHHRKRLTTSGGAARSGRGSVTSQMLMNQRDVHDVKSATLNLTPTLSGKGKGNPWFGEEPCRVAAMSIVGTYDGIRTVAARCS